MKPTFQDTLYYPPKYSSLKEALDDTATAWEYYVSLHDGS